MKKIFTSAILLISVLLLAACSNATGEDNNTDINTSISADQTTAQPESEISTTSTTNIDSASNPVDVQTDRTHPSSFPILSYVDVSPTIHIRIDQRKTTGTYVDETGPIHTQDKSNITNLNLVGTPLRYDELKVFVYDHTYTCDMDRFKILYDFLDSLDNDEQKELFFKAKSMINFMADTIGFQISNYLDLYKKYVDKDYDVYIECEKNGWKVGYIETGYTFDSFFSVLCEIFTKETAEKILYKYPCFLEYNGELWYEIASAGGDLCEVRREYELVNQTDTVLEFRHISFQNEFKLGQDADYYIYDPDKRDEYIKEYVDYKFVLTENGWRVEKFLNAEDPDKEIKFS